MFEKYKKIIIAVIVLVVLFALYAVFIKKDPEAPLTSATVTQLSGEDNELLVLLSELNAIKLDGAFFSDPLFLSLTDFTVNLTLEPRERPNPFAPIGVNGVSSVAVQPQATSTPAGGGL